MFEFYSKISRKTIQRSMITQTTISSVFALCYVRSFNHPKMFVKRRMWTEIIENIWQRFINSAPVPFSLLWDWQMKNFCATPKYKIVFLVQRVTHPIRMQMHTHTNINFECTAYFDNEPASSDYHTVYSIGSHIFVAVSLFQ